MINKINRIVKKLVHTYQNLSVVAKASMWFVACTMLQKSIAFITVPIFTRIMPAEEYGLYSTYLSWLAVLEIICTLNVHNTIYINNYVKSNSQEEKERIAVPLLSLSMTVTIVIFILFLIFYDRLKNILSLPFYLICLLFLQILFEPPVKMWMTQQRFEYKYVKLVFRTISMIFANSVLGISFVLAAKSNQAIARALSIVLVQCVFGTYFYFYFWKRGKKVFSVNGWKHAMNVQLPLLPHSLSLTILSSSDRIMITNIVGAAYSAVYSVAYSAGYVVNVLKSSIVDALRPWIYQKIKVKDYDSIREMVNTVVIIVTLISVCFTAFAPEIIYLMAPAKYHEAVYVIPPVAASSFFTFLYNIFSIISFYHEKTKKIMLASVSGALLNILLNAVLIPRFGYLAAAYTTLVCYVFFAFAHYCIMKGTCRAYMNGIVIYDMRFIVFMSVLMLMLAGAFLITYKIAPLRYAILLCALMFAVMKKEKLLGAIKKLSRKK